MKARIAAWVKWWREAWSIGEARRSRRSVSRRLGVSASVIDSIAWGETWKHVPRPEGFAVEGAR